jgi:hypothetical protein
MFESITKDLTTIYDFGNVSPRYSLILIPALFGVIGIGIMYVAIKSNTHFAPYRYGKEVSREKAFLIGFSCLCFSCLISALLINKGDYEKTKKKYINRDFNTLEGNIENFTNKVTRRGGGRSILFDIGGVHFDVTNYSLVHYGCTSDDLENVNLSNNQFLRITYFTDKGENVILKIQTKGN